MYLRNHALFTLAVIVTLALGLLATGCSGSETTTPAPSGGSSPVESDAAAPGDASTDPARGLVETKCSMCHGLDRVWSADKTPDEWVQTVDRMKANGLVISDDEYEQIVDYLSAQ